MRTHFTHRGLLALTLALATLAPAALADSGRLLPRDVPVAYVIGQAIGVPLAAPVVDRWGATPIFWTAAIVLPALAVWFARAIRRRQLAAVLRAGRRGGGHCDDG